jgi:tetratricopeptide (TPR) repeat protein
LISAEVTFQIIVRGMRLTFPSAALAVSLLGGSHAQAPVTAGGSYEALVHEYRSGNAADAVARAAAMAGPDIVERFKAFAATSPSSELLMAAAAMHTDAALTSRIDIGVPVTNRHLDVAVAIVEVATPPRMKRLGSLDFRKSALPPVPAQFRRLWYLSMISVLENGGRTPDAQAYLENARALFPRDPEFLLLSGIGEEMRASNRLVNISAGDRRKALGYAEVYLRASLELGPARLETRLRLGRVLTQRDHAAEARPLLIAVSVSPDARLSYLAALFLGALEDSAGNPAAAAKWYASAAAKVPSAQAAFVAGSELQHRAGDRHDAAVSLASGIGPNRDDPWWGYLFGEYWRIDIYLNAMRGMARS